MPALTVATEEPMRSRPTSPAPPPMSPITPPMAPAELSDSLSSSCAQIPARRPLTHSTQSSQQIGIPPPPPEPIDFELNPDVIALKTAISVLQIQKTRATSDIQDLSRVRKEALAAPEAFIQDLAAGRVRQRDNSAFLETAAKDEQGESDSEDGDVSRDAVEKETKRPWSSLPNPQNVVRCPPINWAQYAVVGESLDKLHAEQLSRPSQGTPAVFGSNGLYDVKIEGKQEEYPGVAAPYAPGRDIIDRKRSDVRRRAEK